jgi:hypothetical protein
MTVPSIFCKLYENFLCDCSVYGKFEKKVQVLYINGDNEQNIKGSDTVYRVYNIQSHGVCEF